MDFCQYCDEMIDIAYAGICESCYAERNPEPAPSKKFITEEDTSEI